MRDATRPRVLPWTSATYHSRWASPASFVSQKLFCCVFIRVPQGVGTRCRRRIGYRTVEPVSRPRVLRSATLADPQRDGCLLLLYMRDAETVTAQVNSVIGSCYILG